MRITVVSDLHLDARTGGVARLEDIEQALFNAVEFANAQSNYFICLGDVMDPDSGAQVFSCMRVLIQAAGRLHCPSIWLAGNHDVRDDGSNETVLEPLKALGSRVRVIDEPSYSHLDDGMYDGLDFFALPYTPLSKKYNAATVVDSYNETFETPLVIGHLNVKGAMPGDEESMPRGRDVFLPVKEIGEKFPNATVLNGHIHRRQVTKEGVVIPGSLERLNFGEERHRPG